MEADHETERRYRIYDITRKVYGRKLTALFDAFGIPEGTTLLVGENPTFDQAEQQLYQTLMQRVGRLLQAISNQEV